MWVRLFCDMASVQSLIVFIVLLTHLVKPSLQAAVSSKDCPEYQFYDSALDNCEDCRAICDNAKFIGWEEYCRSMCPAYASIIWPLQDKTAAPPKLEDPQPTQPPPAQNYGLPVGISVASLACICVAVAIFLAYRKRGTIMDNIRKWRPERRADREHPEVVIPMIPQEVQDPSPGGSPSLPISTISASSSGVQEEGREPCCSPNGELPFYQIPHGQQSTYLKPSAPFPVQPTSSHASTDQQPPPAQPTVRYLDDPSLGCRGNTKYPVQVAEESGPTAMALLPNSINVPYMSTGQHLAEIHDADHDTELKTLQPSSSMDTHPFNGGAA